MDAQDLIHAVFGAVLGAAAYGIVALHGRLRAMQRELDQVHRTLANLSTLRAGRVSVTFPPPQGQAHSDEAA